jgi:hypothetical protein
MALNDVDDATTLYTDGRYLAANPTWHEEDSPWKAAQIIRMIERNKLAPSTIREVGCGTGEVLARVHDHFSGAVACTGHEISPDAFSRAKRKERDRLQFRNDDLFECSESIDMLLVIDVFEHVRDVYGFVSKCQKRARHKIYHIPLDISVNSVLRASFAFPVNSSRNAVGHLHFFTAESALMLLHETGHRITDRFYTHPIVELTPVHPSVRRQITNIPRRVLSAWSPALAARLLGGLSLLVLAE